MSLSQTISVMFFKTFRFHYKSPLGCVIWLADAKYYSQQLKVNLVFHRPSKSEGYKSWLPYDSSPIYLIAFFFLKILDSPRVLKIEQQTLFLHSKHAND